MRISEVNDEEAAAFTASLGGLGAVVSGPSLTVGSKGDAVRKLQQVLVSFGYPLVVDGIFGAKTAAAVKAVQTKLGLSATGVYDATTETKLMAVNQSGVVDASKGDKAAVAAAAPPTPVTVTVFPKQPEPSPGTLTIAPTKENTAGSSVVASSGESMFDKLVTAVKKVVTEQPLLAAGVVLGGAGLLWLMYSAPKPSTQVSAAVETVGLDELNGIKPKAKRKKRKSKKSAAKES